MRRRTNAKQSRSGRGNSQPGSTRGSCRRARRRPGCRALSGCREPTMAARMPDRHAIARSRERKPLRQSLADKQPKRFKRSRIDRFVANDRQDNRQCRDGGHQRQGRIGRAASDDRPVASHDEQKQQRRRKVCGGPMIAAVLVGAERVYVSGLSQSNGGPTAAMAMKMQHSAKLEMARPSGECQPILAKGTPVQPNCRDCKGDHGQARRQVQANRTFNAPHDGKVLDGPVGNVEQDENEHNFDDRRQFGASGRVAMGIVHCWWRVFRDSVQPFADRPAVFVDAKQILGAAAKVVTRCAIRARCRCRRVRGT